MDDPATRRLRWPLSMGPAARRVRRAAAATLAAVTVTLGSAPPLGAQGADAMGPPTDGGSQARWVVAELALLVVGSIGGRMWAVRRSRRRQQTGGAARSPAGAAPHDRGGEPRQDPDPAPASGADARPRRADGESDRHHGRARRRSRGRQQGPHVVRL